MMFMKFSPELAVAIGEFVGRIIRGDLDDPCRLAVELDKLSSAARQEQCLKLNQLCEDVPPSIRID